VPQKSGELSPPCCVAGLGCAAAPGPWPGRRAGGTRREADKFLRRQHDLAAASARRLNCSRVEGWHRVQTAGCQQGFAEERPLLAGPLPLFRGRQELYRDPGGVHPGSRALVLATQQQLLAEPSRRGHRPVDGSFEQLAQAVPRRCGWAGALASLSGSEAAQALDHEFGRCVTYQAGIRAACSPSAGFRPPHAEARLYAQIAERAPRGSAPTPARQPPLSRGFRKSRPTSGPPEAPPRAPAAVRFMRA